MKFSEAVKIINNTYKELFCEAWTYKRLEREKITAAELDAIADLFARELSRPGATAKTFMQGAAEYYRRHGYAVELARDGVNFIITAPAAEYTTKTA